MSFVTTAAAPLTGVVHRAVGAVTLTFAHIMRMWNGAGSYATTAAAGNGGGALWQ
jgi:hypothetical protein